MIAIETFDLLLPDGEKVRYEYDQEGDILEIFFRPGEASAAIELTESIVLRFDWQTATPLSLSFISFSRLVQPAEHGENYFQLLADEWPEEASDKIWTMLATDPLKQFFQVGSYIPPHTRQTIPIAAVKQPRLLPSAV